MSDRVCSICGVPKPPCCYEYANQRANICQPCHAVQTHNRRWQRDHTPEGKRQRRARADRICVERPDRYADGLARAIEAREGGR